MRPKNWIPMIGQYTLDDDTLIFKGGSTTLPDMQTGKQVGNFINDIEFGGGVLSATIQFHENIEDSGAGLMLFYNTATNYFIEAQLGVKSLCSLQIYTGQQWITQASVGEPTQLKPEEDYKLLVRASGSRVRLELNSVRVIDTNISFPIPKGPTGIWAFGLHNISFKNFEVQQEKPKIFVIMQFTDQFNELYKDVIKPVGSEYGFDVIRADERFGPGLILSDVERQINEARAIVADITPKNPNVYWEVGYAHALRKPTILIAQRATELPFDVSPFRTLFYDNTIAGKSRIEEGLRQHLSAIQTDWPIMQSFASKS